MNEMPTIGSLVTFDQPSRANVAFNDFNFPTVFFFSSSKISSSRGPANVFRDGIAVPGLNMSNSFFNWPFSLARNAVLEATRYRDNWRSIACCLLGPVETNPSVVYFIFFDGPSSSSASIRSLHWLSTCAQPVTHILFTQLALSSQASIPVDLSEIVPNCILLSRHHSLYLKIL